MQNNKADIMFVVLCYVLLFFCLFVFSFINEGIPFLQQTANLSDVNFDVCGIKMAGCVQDEVRLFIPRKRKAKTVYFGCQLCYLSLNSIVERHYLTFYGTKTSLEAQFFAFY